MVIAVLGSGVALVLLLLDKLPSGTSFAEEIAYEE